MEPSYKQSYNIQTYTMYDMLDVAKAKNTSYTKIDSNQLEGLLSLLAKSGQNF